MSPTDYTSNKRPDENYHRRTLLEIQIASGNSPKDTCQGESITNTDSRRKFCPLDHTGKFIFKKR